jgi:hypothetical protein
MEQEKEEEEEKLGPVFPYSFELANYRQQINISPGDSSRA